MKVKITACMGEKPMVSIIIPFYNTEDYIQVCLESVLNQTYQNFEIICVCDGSQDRSLEIVRHMMLDTDKIRLIQIENHGQGYARNLALKQAKGKYILFVDSDDWIEPKTLELTVKKAEKENPDFVLFDYRYFNPINKTETYCQKVSYFSEQRLIGDECKRLLEQETLYSVNILYSREYLEKNQIAYMEGYIYEDVPFMTMVLLNAKSVSLIHSPLYRVTVNRTSTTQTGKNTDRHCIGFLAALRRVVPYVNASGIRDDNVYFLYLNLFKKFMYYYSIRIPNKYKHYYVREFLSIFYEIEYLPDLHKSRAFSLYIKNRSRAKNHATLFHFVVFGLRFVKPKIDRGMRKAKQLVKKMIGFAKRLKRKLTLKKNRDDGRIPYQTFLKQDIYEDVILFMGFDYRYTGNSRYLFDEMIKTFDQHSKKIFFVTNDVRVPLEYRIKPKSERCNRFVARAKTVIFESWIPLEYEKRNGVKWIQLWHGIPLKRMLFDSNEKYLNARNPLHKHYKFTDLQRWDYFLVNNENSEKYFETAFLLPRYKMIPFGYPRVKYLLEKKNDARYRNSLRNAFGFDEGKKIVLYMPTWRDCNYGLAKAELKTDYFLDLNALQNELGDQYEVVFKDHPYLSGLKDTKFRNLCDCETQELLLACDYLITDYSSVMFDAMEIDLPIILYCKDFEENANSRGVYSDIWADVRPFECKDINEIVERIQSYSIDTGYEKCKEKYGYREAEKNSLTEFIYNL